MFKSYSSFLREEGGERIKNCYNYTFFYDFWARKYVQNWSTNDKKFLVCFMTIKDLFCVKFYKDHFLFNKIFQNNALAITYISEKPKIMTFSPLWITSQWPELRGEDFSCSSTSRSKHLHQKSALYLFFTSLFVPYLPGLYFENGNTEIRGNWNFWKEQHFLFPTM